MMKRRFGDNPFYALLAVCGVLFTLTAASYFVMTLRADDAGGEPLRSGLTRLMADYGAWLMAAELAVLAALCAAAMLSDDYWVRRSEARRKAAGAANDERPPTSNGEHE